MVTRHGALDKLRKKLCNLSDKQAKGSRVVAFTNTVAYLGLEARAVEVQCQVAPGLPKDGSHYDLPIALALLAAMGVTDVEQLVD